MPAREFGGLGEPSRSGCWPVAYLFSGSTAILLLVGTAFPQYWYVSFIALVPFLYRILHAPPSEALRVGPITGFAFAAVSNSDRLLSEPATATAAIFLITLLFGTFAWAASNLSRRCQLGPVSIALLWVGFELVLLKVGVRYDWFGVSLISSSPFAHALATLFGTVIVSFAIVLLNSLLVAAVEKFVDLVKTTCDVAASEHRTFALEYVLTLATQKCYLIPESRGPPNQ